MKITKSILLLFSLFFCFSAFSQLPGGPSINAGADQVLSCAVNSTTLTAIPFAVGQTTAYSVSSIPHVPPIAYNASGGTVIPLVTDDDFSNIINLPFSFCYYNTNFTSIKVGPNGGIKFNPTTNGGIQTVNSNPCPSSTLSSAGDILAVFQDLDPSLIVAPNSLNAGIKYYTQGTTPNRIFAICFYEIPVFGCATSRATNMIVMYETTNVIDVYVEKKPLCLANNSGSSIIGLQNPAGSLGINAPGRNALPNWLVTVPEAWRFTPSGPNSYSIAWSLTSSPFTALGSGVSINVSPTSTTSYTAKITYFKCNGQTVVLSDNVSVSYGSLIAPSVTPTAESCNNYNNGSVIIDNQVGAGPFTVVISGPLSATIVEPNTAIGQAIFNNLPDGNYTFTATGNHGCQTNGNFTIGQGGNCCAVSVATTPSACSGVNSGTAIATASNVAAPFSYAWSTGPTSQSISGLATGNYTVTITDGSGCVASSTGIITSTSGITITTDLVSPTCVGSANGSIDITATGGTGVLMYKLNNGTYTTNPTFTGLVSNSYTVYVRDANLCIQTLIVNLVNPPAVTITAPNPTPATCGENNGAFTIIASNAAVPFTFSNNGSIPQSVPTFTNLAPQTYLVTIVDANSCTGSLAVVVPNQGSPVATVLTQQNVSCFGGNNGSVLIGVTGGTSPYSFSLNNNAYVSSNTFNNLVAGIDSVYVYDQFNCTSKIGFTISQPNDLNYTFTTNNLSCNNVCTGSITMLPTGGTAPYQFSINGGVTYSSNPIFSNLCAGLYNTVVLDVNGCIINYNATLTEPTLITSTASFINPVCHDTCSGSITLNASGGISPYTFAINNGLFQTNNTFQNLCSGPKNLQVKDGNNCISLISSFITNPPAINIDTVSMTPSNCGSSNGALEMIATGLHPNFSYSLNGSAFQTSGVFPFLTSGGYSVLVRDAIGCENLKFFGVNDIEMTGVLISLDPTTCHNSLDGFVSVASVNGIAPIRYLLDGGPDQPLGDFFALSPGNHIVVLFDNGNCVFTFPFAIVEPDTILFDSSVSNVSCNGGSNGTITVSNVTGGNGGFEYSIDNGNNFQTSPVFLNQAVGTFSVVVRDVNGCLGYGSATITQPAPLIMTANATNLLCYNDGSGFIQMSAIGGNGNYSFSNGGPFNTTGSFSSLVANTYTLVVKDQLNCTQTQLQTVTQPSPLGGTFTVTPASCNGICDGKIITNVFGGTPNYQFSVDNGITFSTSPTVVGLCSGGLVLLYRDANNCYAFTNQFIPQPSILSFDSTVVNATCSQLNGSISLVAAGGSTPYLFSISTPSAVSIQNAYTSLSPTTYNVFVEDNQGCLINGVATVSNNPGPIITGISVSDPLCNNDCNGTITANVFGGNGAVLYKLVGPSTNITQTTNLFSNLCSGVYVLTITDASACFVTQNITLVNPTVLSFTHTYADLKCNNDFSGWIAFNAIGGTQPYNYSTSNTGSSLLDSIPFLSAGTYPLIVTDFHNCIAISTQTLIEPTILTLNSQTSMDNTCHNSCDGSATVQISGGTGSYNYLWSNNVLPIALNNVTGLCAGTLTVSVLDQNLCSITAQFLIQEPAALEILALSVTAPNCFGDCNASIEITAPSALDFSKDGFNFQTSNIFDNLCAGNYTITLRDAGGCSSNQVVQVINPSQLIQSLIPEDGNYACFGDDIMLNANAIGGTGSYTYVWNTGDSTSSILEIVTDTIVFSCTVYDQNGCVSNVQNATITVYPELQTFGVASSAVCPGAPNLVNASSVNGLAGYTYQWLNANLDTLGTGDTFTFSPIVSDSVLIVGTDQCNAKDTVMVYLSVFPLSRPTFVVDTLVGCSPLSSVFTVTAATAATSTFSWNFGDGISATGLNATKLYLDEGCYDVTLIMTSQEGCIIDSTYTNAVCVLPIPQPDFDYVPKNPTNIENTIHFGNITTGNNSYFWDFNMFGSDSTLNPYHTFDSIEASDQTICLTATSQDGCIGTICKVISFTDELMLFVPNTFTPNEDQHNALFQPKWSREGLFEDYSFEIYNRWGQVVFSSKDQNAGWDGKFNGKIGLSEVFTWVIIAKGRDVKRSTKYSGLVTLLK
jgi:large repetitive protein